MARAGMTGSVLRRLLEAADYRLEDRPGGVRGIRSRDHRAVFLVEGVRSPVELEAEFPSDAVRRTLIYPEDPGSVARSIASERSMEVIDGATLGSALGEILLPGPEPVPSSEIETVATPAPLTPPPLLFPEGERTVRPRLGRADAEALAGVEGLRSTLRLIPYYIAAYRVRVATPSGARAPATDHLVAVQALTGAAEFWQPGERELIPEIDEPNQRLDPQISEDQSRTVAVEAVRRRHTVSVDHTEQHDGALVIERRRVPPAADDLAIGEPVLVHVPFWYIEGTDGRVVLDAVTGSRSPPPDREG